MIMCTLYNIDKRASNFTSSTLASMVAAFFLYFFFFEIEELRTVLIREGNFELFKTFEYHNVIQ